MSRPALERLRGNALSRKASIYALCLLFLAQLSYGCRPRLDNGSTRSQPVMVKIQRAEVKPTEVQPGQVKPTEVQPGKQATFRVWYSVLAPPGKSYLKVQESRRLFFN
jgi:hypothetical protein